MAQESPLFSDGPEFEDEVRRIARQLWPAAQFDGATKHAERERDGVFFTEEMVHVLECTMLRTKEKAENDIEKIVKLVKHLQGAQRARGVKGWFVTLDEPTVDQRAVADRHKGFVVACSYDQFRSRLIDARTYIDLRRQHPFGSVWDPETESRVSVRYVPLDMARVGTSEYWKVGDVVESVSDKGRVLILGDYGAGKSTTMREIFLVLAASFVSQKARSFPILLNMREHQGQTDPVEALERHARLLGYPYATHLVRAWRSGYAHVLLDGFDELTTVGVVSRDKKLHDLRFAAMELIRRFVRETPPASGLVLSGRFHFFDNDKELVNALALQNVDLVHLELGAFGDKQVGTFLKACSWTGPVPAWLPPRPLLLAYLAWKKFLPQVAEIEASVPPAAGWNALLNAISAREAEMEVGIDGDTVRRIIERLATRSRTQPDGLAELTPEAIVDVFREVCGYAPDGRAMVVLQRLPGLGRSPGEEGARRFVDADLADSARAGDVARYISDPFSNRGVEPSAWQCSLDRLGVEVCATQVASLAATPGKFHVAVKQAVSAGHDLLASEIVRVGNEAGVDHSGADLAIRGALIPVLSLAEGAARLDGIQFHECMFRILELDGVVDPARAPRLFGCYIGQLDGRVGDEDLPSFLEGCIVDAYSESAATNAAILGSSLATGTKVLLTVLRKLYAQRGSGRKESAFFRGLDHRDRRLVPEVLALVSSRGLAVKSRAGETIWHPVRSETSRVMRVLTAPKTCGDSLIAESAALQ